MPVPAPVDRARAPGFDAEGMSQPPHIYASTLRRRARRWNRRRAIWPFALAALAAVATLALLAGFLLGGLG
jgi:anti-sigma-K factor RskA